MEHLHVHVGANTLRSLVLGNPGFLDFVDVGGLGVVHLDLGQGLSFRLKSNKKS